MKKLLKLFVVFSLCFSQLFVVTLYENVSALEGDESQVTEGTTQGSDEETTNDNEQNIGEDNEEENSSIDTDDTSNSNNENTTENTDVQPVENVEENIGKEVVNINDSWTFTNYDDKQSNVNLPHCWEYVHPTMSYIPQMNSKVCSYEKILDVSKYKNKNVFLKFYGVNKNATLYINGEKVGEHIGGFSAFVFDITNYIKGDSIQIKVDTKNIDTVSIPVQSDFTHWAGLYRDVELIATNDAYISTEDYGTKGIYIDQSFSGNDATATVKTKFSSKATEAKDYKVVTSILDKNGQEVSKNEQNINLLANKSCQENVQSLTVENVHRWNGTNDPYLYTVKVELKDMEDKIYDTQTQKVGFRTIKVKDGKFYLNSKLYKLNGVGMHQDREGYGNATTKEMKEEDINTIMEMGANAVRTAHYAHDQSLYDLADEKGLIVWTEIPFYLLMADTTTFKETTKQQLVELIRQNYNHPSIICWGIQNEVNTNSAFAQFGQEFNVSTETLSAFMKDLASLAKKEDSSRFIVQAHIDGTAKLNESLNWTRNSDIDYTGFNLYYGFKSQVKAADDTGRETIKRQFTNKVQKNCEALGQDSIIISEYGAGGNIDQHATIDSNFSWSGNDTEQGIEHPEEYQSYVLEAAYDAISKQDKVWVAFVWNMFDFSSYRNSGGHERTNNKGLICYDHKTKKDAFYFYKANWNKTDKFAYITSRRKADRTAEDSTIKVYSNCEKVRLTVAGKDYGYGKLQQDGVFTWDNVKYAGKNTEIQAVGESGDKEYTDKITVNGPADSENVSVKYKSHIQDIGWQSDWQKDGSTSGTVGKSKQLEAIKIELTSDVSEGEILYKSHVQDYGWQSGWKSDGQISGTVGNKKRLEAIKIKLNGNVSEKYDVYYRVHVQDYGWLDWAKNGGTAGTEGLSKRIEAIEIKLVEKGADAPGNTSTPCIIPKLEYSTHIQDIGWQGSKYDGATSGTTGKSKRLEAIKINIKNKEYTGDVKYQAHIQDIGWQDWKANGQISGTSGQSKRLEAIRIKLTDEMAEKYDIYYRVHAQNFGWLDWAKNGESAGTAGYSYRLEAIEVKLVEKGGKAPGSTSRSYVQRYIRYQTHIQDIGWQENKYDGQTSGTTGRSKRLEAIQINLSNPLYSGSVQYQTHVQDIGWQSWKTDGAMAGTSGKSKRLEAIRIKLTGQMAEKYDIYYRVHAQDYGWLGWAKNGASSGTEGMSKRLEAIEIVLVQKGGSAPGSTANSYYKK